MQALTTGRAVIRERLEARRSEIERSLLARVYGISDPATAGDPEYVAGIQDALGAAFDHALSALVVPDGHRPAIPPALLAQARLAAQNSIALDVVLRRYVAGFTVVSDFVLQEAADWQVNAGPKLLQDMLRSHASLLDQVLDAVSEEHRRARAEVERPSSRRRRLDRVRRLLAGEPTDATDLAYPLDAWHIALVASGGRPEQQVRALSRELDRVALIVEPQSGTLWIWLGGRRPPKMAEVDAVSSWSLDGATAALGEPGKGLSGWRLSHQQARAAVPISLRVSERSVRYRDVTLMTAALTDDLLARSLHQLYIEPLQRAAGPGESLQETLRAYFETNGKLSSTAATLGVDRHTVSRRLKTAEGLLDRPLADCRSQLELALRMEQLAAAPCTESVQKSA